MSNLGDAIRLEAGFRPISSERLKTLAEKVDTLEQERDEYAQAVARVTHLAELLRGGRHGLVTYQILSAIEGGIASIEDWPND